MSNPTWAQRLTMAAVSAVLAGSAVLSTAVTASATATRAPISTVPMASLVQTGPQHQNIATSATGRGGHWEQRGWWWSYKQCRKMQQVANKRYLYTSCNWYLSVRGRYWVLWVWVEDHGM